MGYSQWDHKESNTTEQAHMYTKIELVRSKSRELEKERSSIGSEVKVPSSLGSLYCDFLSDIPGLHGAGMCNCWYGCSCFLTV